MQATGKKYLNLPVTDPELQKYLKSARESETTSGTEPVWVKNFEYIAISVLFRDKVQLQLSRTWTELAINLKSAYKSCYTTDKLKDVKMFSRKRQ